MITKKELKEYNEYLKKTPYDEWFPFQCILRRIKILNNYKKIIDNHPEELNAGHRRIIESKGIDPSSSLNDYIILEIRNFYQITYKKYPKTEFPSTYPIVKSFRDNLLGHFTKKTPVEVIELFEETEDIGFLNICKEFEAFASKVQIKVKSEINTTQQ